MAGGHTDEQINHAQSARIRNGRRSYVDGDEGYSARRTHHLPACDPQSRNGYLTLEQSAQYLGVSVNSVRGMIQQKILSAEQVVPCAPWRISVALLDSEEIRKAVTGIRVDCAARELNRPKGRNTSTV